MATLYTDAVAQALHKLLTAQFPDRQYTYKVQNATEKGDNYIGEVYRIIVTFAADANVFSIILKVPPSNPLRRKQFFARPCFLRESLAYSEFLVLAKEFQSSRVTAVHEQFHEFGECYLAMTDEFNEAIIMEDLQARDFKLFSRFDEFSCYHVALVMRIYAKLHAVSFAIKDQQKDQLKKFQTIKDIFEQQYNDVQLGVYFEGLKKSALSSIKNGRACDASYVNILENYFAQATFFDLLLAMLDSKSCEPYAVVCHGDCWTNNILFKEENGRVIDACLIDWQVMRYSSPVTDLLYFLFTCTTSDFRRQHFYEMLHVYYAELAAHIKRLGSEPTILFSRDEFDDQLRSRGAVGLLFAMIVLPIITTRSKDVPNLEQLSEQIEAGATKDLKSAGFLSDGNEDAYNIRMRGVIVDCIDFGYIK